MSEQQRHSTFQRALREPTVHFALIAAALFAVNGVVQAIRGDVIEISRSEIDLRILQAQTAAGVPLDAEQRRQVEEALVDERVLVREALALGLEEDDRIHDILAQKMLHVLSGEVIQPTTAELEAFYAENRMYYAPEPAVTIDEIVLPGHDPLPPALSARLAEGVPPDELSGEDVVDRGILSEVTYTDLAAIFDGATAARVVDAAPGVWVGPHLTARGQHWLRVSERHGVEPPPLEMVREEVRNAWIAQQEEARLAERVEELRAKYTIVISEPEVEE